MPNHGSHLPLASSTPAPTLKRPRQPDHDQLQPRGTSASPSSGPHIAPPPAKRQRTASPPSPSARRPPHPDTQMQPQPQPQPSSQPQTAPPPDDVHTQLCDLLSFWLSPHNLSKDAHLVDALTRDPDGWTPVSVFLSFHKVRTLSAKHDDVVRALGSLRSPRIQLKNDPTAVPTTTAATPPTRFRLRGGRQQLRKDVAAVLADVDHRTVFVTHVPPSADRAALESAFRAFGRVVFVSLPRLPSGAGRGFAFVEFATVREARQCVATVSRTLGSAPDARAPLPTLPTVRAFPHAEWLRRQRSRKKRNADRARTDPRPSADPPPGNVPEDTPRSSHPPAPAGAHAEAGRAEEAPLGSERWTQGLVLHVRGLGKATGRGKGGGKGGSGGNRPQAVSRRRLYEAFGEYGPISFIEYSPRRNDECFVRFLHTSAATRALAALSGMDPTAPNAPRAHVLGAPVHAQLLAGQRERDYWRRVFAGRNEKAARKLRRAESAPSESAPASKAPSASDLYKNTQRS